MALDIKFGAKLFTHPNVNTKIKETDFYYTSIWKSYKIKNTFCRTFEMNSRILF